MNLASLGCLAGVLFLLLPVDAYKKSYRVTVNVGGSQQQEDVFLDDKKQYAVVTLLPTKGILKLRSSVNLHDFSTGFSVVKDFRKGKCFLFHNLNSLKNVQERLRSVTKYNEVSQLKEYKWTCHSKVLPYKEVLEMAGRRIANFCRNYAVQFVKSSRVKRRRVKRAAQAQYGCFMCFFRMEKERAARVDGGGTAKIKNEDKI